MGDVLGAVADAEDRHLAPERFDVHMRRIGVAHRAGASRQDDPADLVVQRRHFVKGVNLAKNVKFPEPPSDQLRNLGTAIQNDDSLHTAKIDNSRRLSYPRLQICAVRRGLMVWDAGAAKWK